MITLPRFSLLFLLSLVSAPSWGESGSSEDSRFGIGLEFGAVGFSKNDVRIPGNTGTKFDMTDLTGSGPDAFARLEGYWNINDRHGLRLVLAPLEVSGSGELREDTDFAGETFPAGATEGIYKFNAYKLTWRYTFRDRDAWRWRIGFTGVIRDANIELRQSALQANDDDLGFVPALHVSGEYRFDDRWLFVLDVDGLAGGPGRLFDVALKLEYDLTEHWRIGAGYRTLEGGADTDDVYTFAWLHYGLLDISYRF
jgi:hypothetical protein